jgi:hypothetical protein
VRKIPACLSLVLALAVVGTPWLRGQNQGGTIQGEVVDPSGAPLADATVYLSSPAMLGVKTFVTVKRGAFDFSALAPGDYLLSAEKPEHQTLVGEKIALRAGMSVFLRIELAASEAEVEVVSSRRAPVLDNVTPKASVVRDRFFLPRLPLARNFAEVLNSIPGAVSPGYDFREAVSIHGGTVRENAFLLDGANLTDPWTSAPLVPVNVDILEEVEVVSSGQPVPLVPARGGFVNIVTKSGGNAFGGELALHLINEGWNRSLWSKASLDERGVPAPSGDKNLIDGSLSVGGAFLEDRAWYFLNGRLFGKSQENNFVAPFTDTLGRSHDTYAWSEREATGFFKLTVRPISEVKFSAWVNFSSLYRPVAEDPSPRLPFLSTHVLDSEKTFAVHGALDYSLGPGIEAFIRGTFLNRIIPTPLQSDALSLSWTDDAGDLYGPTSGADYSSEAQRQRLQVDASLRILLDRAPGGPHNLTVGADFDNASMDLDWWRADNLRRYRDSRNPNGNTYGDLGLLGFWLCGPTPGTTTLGARQMKLGAFLSDSFGVGRRLTFHLGLRFDRSWGWFPGSAKSPSANPLSLYLGDALVSPSIMAAYPDIFPGRFNPWDSMSVAEMTGVISWNALSPRAGLVYDFSGSGKAIFKASYARYADELSFRYYLPMNPLYPREISVYWFDANADERPDIEDEFSLPKLDYRFFAGSFGPRVAEDLRAPVTEEISAGFEREIWPDFTLGVRAVSRVQKNILEDVLFDPDTGEIWSGPDAPASGTDWIPFTTTVPGTESFSDQTVTLYARSLSASPAFLQLRNVPELERKYRALEFTFEKRFRRGWQLAGSLVLSKSEGNIGGFADETTALTSAADSPNYFINRSGRLDTDRPIQFKLFGTLELSKSVWLSGLFHYQSGLPWQRSVQVLPPADWCEAVGAERIYYAVNLEASGSRREEPWSTLDLRLEKQFRIGSSGRLRFYADVTNLLGSTAAAVGLNDADRWEPFAAGANQPGLKVLRPDYQVTNAAYGRRTIRFGFRLGF